MCLKGSCLYASTCPAQTSESRELHAIILFICLADHSDKWFHTHPELSFCEKETAAAIVKHLESFNAFEIHPHIGGHGLAAVLKNGEGNTLLLRADIDALPVQEQTGLEYASTKRMKDVEGTEKPVMHACGQ